MIYRTKTYIAADWTGDGDAVEQLLTWNKGKRWGLSFGDAHELSSCRSDDTNNCNIKRNCSQNLDHSKAFVLIVGDKTKDTRAGYCMYCKAYNTCRYTYRSNKSFIEFECKYAVNNNLPIIVLYNSNKVNTRKCIDSVISIARAHVAMKDPFNKWNYLAVKAAFDKLWV